MPSYKLIYFAGRGRAEATRMAFAYGGIPFEDVRMSGPKLMAARESGEVTPPFGQFPYMEITGDDGVKTSVGQSCTLLRFAARKAGLYPADEVAAAVADSVVDQVADVAAAAYGAVFAPADAKAAALETLHKEKLPKLLKGIVAILGDKKYVVGDAISVADISLAAQLEGAIGYGIDLSPYPTLTALVDRVKADPKLQAYLAQREATEAAEKAAAAAAASS